ncbi:uncharacterized protein LOC120850076 [Ixodes scapularis]|uniref:uncharacterized protein LOC120850076 n=1 Tax=Ixodes scapularis TaxID=6945 RepID=UPI001C38A06A|nr:uncharacterized protein LOC120850076 [Ixodes scapularis]
MDASTTERVAQNEPLITLVYSKRAIWDQESVLYRNSDLKANSWKFVCTGMGLTEKDEDIRAVMKRWRNLCDTFGKKLKEMKKRSSAGAAEPALKWAYISQMLFLRDIMEPRVTTSNIELDVENENSVQEVLQGYEEELEDSASQILSAIVDGRGSDSPAHSASSTPTHSPHAPPTLPSQSAALHPQASTSAPCRSLPSPQSVYAAFANPVSPNTLSGTSRPPSQKRTTNDTELIQDIDRQLQNKETPSQQFLLSLSSHLDIVPEHLYGYCKIHFLDVVLQYRRGVIPTTLMQVQGPQNNVQ